MLLVHILTWHHADELLDVAEREIPSPLLFLQEVVDGVSHLLLCHVEVLGLSGIEAAYIGSDLLFSCFAMQKYLLAALAGRGETCGPVVSLMAIIYAKSKISSFRSELPIDICLPS